MKLSEIRTLLKCEILLDVGSFENEVSQALCSDMMSDVLAFAEPGALLITGLTNSQSVRTADFADACAILYIRGKKPDLATIELAKELCLPVLTTEYGMFDVCGKLFAEGIGGIC